ncbi:hypothetical protein KGF54_004245 [Candida jiufengensis]|uniref:uncharacterized protein n=1 Tax=Candida jiufengensis TaxID=497108 RepID=UPI002224D81A|nr:uncharacterized protein KGF54_004245 [Candida jiufengensis]KAI5951171.1 hypothetical protein KGF54_004245 [Candida jiufengensis]
MTNSGLVTPHSRPGTPSGLINSPPPQLNTSTSINSTHLQLPINSNISTQPTSTTSTPSNKQKEQQQQQHVPSYEKSIYEQLFSIYKTLLDLKNNRNKYINSKQIYSIYDLFLNIINDLKLTRKDEELKGITLNLPNGNDLIIDDIFQLLSLCFVTCGLIKFAPATYSSLSAVMKLLTHLKECKVYTMDDLKPVGSRLQEIKDILISTRDKYDNDDDDDEEHKLSKNHQMEETLLRNKLNKCESLYDQLVDNFKNIPSDLEPIYHELINIRANLLNFVTQGDSINNSQVSIDDLNSKISKYKNQLKNIEKLRDESDGKFHSEELLDENKLDSIQAILNGLIDDCNNLIADLLIHDEEISLENLKLSNDYSSNVVSQENSSDLKLQYDYIYKTLQNLKTTLDNLLLTRRWTLRETDLYTYQKTLKSIDEQRLKIVEQTPKGTFKKYQTLILYLLRRCYSIIYKLLESSEPVSESLTPIHNQLQTVKRCLLELKRVDGVNNLRELYPFQFKLASIDNLKKDGKFIIDRNVPEGQGALCALLSECFDIIQEMKIELEEKEIEEDEEPEEEENTTTKNYNGSGSLASHIAHGGSFTNSKDVTDGSSGIEDDVEIKRNRFQEFNEADYDLESESAFDDDDDDDDLSISESEYEGNDYY